MTFGNFMFTETPISGVFIIDTVTFGDERGYFTETYKKSNFDAAGLIYDFVQDNQSGSRKAFSAASIFSGRTPRRNWCEC